jgi:hypothetical protein
MGVHMRAGLVVVVMLVAGCSSPPAGDEPAGEGEGETGEGEGEPAGEGEGEGEGESCVTADDCAGLVYSPCTCATSDPCGWSADGVCDAPACEDLFGFTFEDDDCSVDPCSDLVECLAAADPGDEPSFDGCEDATAYREVTQACVGLCAGNDCTSCTLGTPFCSGFDGAYSDCAIAHSSSGLSGAMVEASITTAHRQMCAD